MRAILILLVFLFLVLPGFAVQIIYVCPTSSTGNIQDPVTTIWKDLGIVPERQVVFFGKTDAVVMVNVTSAEAEKLRTSGKIVEISPASLSAVSMVYSDSIGKYGFNASAFLNTGIKTGEAIR